MASDWQLPEVERVFAQAAFGTTSWNDAMETVAEVARGIGAIMHPVTGRQSRTKQIFLIGLSSLGFWIDSQAIDDAEAILSKVICPL